MFLRTFRIFYFVFFIFIFLSHSPVEAANIWTSSTLDSTGNVGNRNAIAVGNDNFVRVVYKDVTNNNLKFIQCTNDDCSTKNTNTINSSGNVGDYVSIAVGSDGNARIAFLLGGGDQDLLFIQCTDASCSTRNTTTIDATGTVGAYNAIALGTGNLARISYRDGTNNDLKMIQCTNADCSTRNTTTVDSTDTVGVDTSIAIGTDGFARISHYDATNQTLKFVQCSDASCSSSTITTIDSTGNVGTYTSLKLSSNLAQISYYDVTNGDLKFVSCANESCSSNTIRTLDSTGDVGLFTSLALNSSGLARISYYDSTNTDLKYLTCSDSTCSSSTTNTLDSTGTVGLYTSLALSNNLSRISYYDSTNGDLKLNVESVPVEQSFSSSSSGSSAASNTNSPASPPSCTDSVPTNSPELFQVNVTNTTATIYFAPASNAHKYFVSYGNGDTAEQHGIEFETGRSSGVLSYTINQLSPGSSYSFKVRGGNGCMPGNWSNIMKVTTIQSSGISTAFYKNFVSRVLSTLPHPVSNAGSGSAVLGDSTAQAQCTEHVVQVGDNLWNIATHYFGKGSQYQSIMTDNNLSSTILPVGQTLKVGCS